jgi:hypothetical protein
VKESLSSNKESTELKKTSFQYSTSEEDELQKRSVLQDLQHIKANGGILTKEWTLDDCLEDMLLEIRKQTLVQDEKSNVNMMRDGMRLLITGMEMVNSKIGLLDLDGWSTEVCRDLHKHDADLSRVYRKYWRRGHNTSPEMSIAMSLFGSMGMYHFRRSMSKHLINKVHKGNSFANNRKKTRMQHNDSDSSEDDEEAPPKK